MFVCFQDPLWRPGMGRAARLCSEAAYLSWRVTQGNYRRGIATRLRRLRGVYDDANISDTAEYHAVRQGVDQTRLVDFLSGRFDDVALTTYWSTPAGLWQRLGDRIGVHNTFAVVARGYRPPTSRAPERSAAPPGVAAGATGSTSQEGAMRWNSN